MKPTLHIDATGMFCAVGHSTDAASAAIRAGLDLFQETDFCDLADNPLIGALPDGMPLGELPPHLGKMFEAVLEECMAQAPELIPEQTPLLLLTAEPERPGLPQTWARDVFAACTAAHVFHSTSRICPWGKAGLGLTLPYAERLLTEGAAPRVLIAGVDSYFDFETIMYYLKQARLITGYNSDGFHPGEGAGAVVLSLGKESQPGTHIMGTGFAEETGHRMQRELPNRAEGMTAAIRMAAVQSGHPLSDTCFHYSDCSGEAFYFRETVHALVRCFEHTVPEYPHLTAGSTLGETGAAVGPLLLAHCTRLLCRTDGYGNRALLHFSADDGKRAAVIAEYR